jgi:hypothetical protein
VQINADLSLEEINSKYRSSLEDLTSQTKVYKTEGNTKAWPSECGSSLQKISKIDSILSRVNNILATKQKSFNSENDLSAKVQAKSLNNLNSVNSTYKSSRMINQSLQE